MCGVVASIGKPGFLQKSVFDVMLTTAMHRGFMATGVAGVTGKGDPAVFKDTVTPLELMWQKEYRATIKDDNIAMMGHCRAPTKGANVRANAHPFQHKHITLVHNGTIHNSNSILPDVPYKDMPDTDSEAICIAIAEYGITKVWQDKMGAATLIWWDNKENKLFFISDGQRPLHFAYAKGKEYAFIASEKWMVEVPMDNAGIEQQKNSIWLPGDNQLYAIEWNSKHQKIDVHVKELKATRPFVQPTMAEAQQPHTTETTGEAGTGVKPNTHQQTQQQPGLWERYKNSKLNQMPESSNQENTTGSGTEQPKKDTGNSSKLSEDYFYDNYLRCVFCKDSLVGEWGTANVIDDESAACADCSNTALEAGINMARAARNVA